MRDTRKTKTQLLDELTEMRRQLSQLVTVEAERQQAVAALRESEAKYRTLIEQLPAATYVAALDEVSSTLYQSPQIEQIVDFTAQEWTSDPDLWARQLHPDDRERVLAELAHDHATGEPFRCEYRLIARDGREVWVRDEAVTVRDETGKPLVLQGVIFDVTERKRMEEELARYREHLEQLVRERTAQLEAANRQLEQEIAERKRAGEELARRAREMAALYETSLEVNSQPDIPTLLRTVVERATALLGVPMGGLYLVRPDDQTLQVVVSHNLPQDYVGLVIRPGEGVAGRVAQTGQPLMVEDYHQWEGRLAVYADAPFYRVLGVPLKAGGKVMGVILVDDDHAGPFTEDEIRLVSLFADQAAIAVENARLFEAEREQRELAETLRQVGAALAATLDADTVLDRLLEQLVRVVPNDIANLMIIEGENASIVRRRGYEQWGIDERVPLATFPMADLPNLVTMAQTGEPVVVSDTSADPKWIRRVETSWQRSYAGAPIRALGKTIGFLNVGSAVPGFYTPQHAERLGAFADQAAIALENARLFSMLNQEKRRLEFLYRLSQQLAQSLDVHEVAQRALDGLRVVVGLLRGLVAVRSSLPPGEVSAGARDRLQIVAISGYDAESVEALDQRLQLRVGDGLIGWAAVHRQLAVVDDVALDSRWMAVSSVDEWVRSAMSVPLLSGDELVGALNIYSEQTAFFTGDLQQLAESAAATVAVAIVNARLYSAERQRVGELARALERQRELERLQREFIQNVSHELRTPLALIRGHAEVLENGWLGELSPEQKESLGVITRRAQMLGRLVEDIMGILEVEQRELTLEVVDLAALVRTAVADFEPAAQKAGLALRAEIAPNLPAVMGDVIALRRVLDNLMGNAFKFTPAGGRVTVSLSQKDQALVLQVADTGIGIPGDQLGRIFERFYQVDGSSTRKYGGMGLGLSLVKSIVEAHGGHISATSEVGKGTTFYFSIPVNMV